MRTRSKRMTICNGSYRGSRFAPTWKGANISDSNEGKLVSDRLGYGSAPFASVMRRINDVTFAKGLRCNGKTGVNTTLNAVLELYAGNLHVQFLGAAFPRGNVAILSSRCVATTTRLRSLRQGLLAAATRTSSAWASVIVSLSRTVTIATGVSKNRASCRPSKPVRRAC
jgi:hypothetical protein